MIMKKKALMILLSLPAVLSLAGCGEKEEEVVINDTPRVREEKEADPTPTPEVLMQQEPPEDPIEEPDTADYEEVYAPVLVEIWGALDNGYDFDREYKYFPTGLMECVMYEDKDILLNSVGYRIEDISGDGVPELLVGRNEETDTGVPGEVSTVYACYACPDGEPVMVFEGMTRSTFRWIGDGSFYYFGSGGASYSMFGQCHLNYDGTEQIWDDYYFTDENDDMSLSFYHNTTGAWDTAVSEKLEMTDAEFFTLLSDVHYEVLDWEPFVDGLYSDGSSIGSGAAVLSVEWADDVVDDTTDYIAYEPDYTDQYTTHVLISTDSEVRDFTLYELSLADVDDNGKAEYDMKECFSVKELKPDKPLCAGMNFPGDMPNNGFKYTDRNGTEHFFVISVSGRDGSLVVTEE